MKKIAIIGCGRIANSAYFPSFTQMENVEVTYVCDIIKEKAEKAKEEYPSIKNAITDYISSNEMKFNPDRTHIQTTKFFYAKLNKNLSYKCLEWFTSLKKEDEFIFYQ